MAPCTITSDLAKALGFLPDDWWNGMEPMLVSSDEDGAGWFWPVEVFEDPRRYSRVITPRLRSPGSRLCYPTHDDGDDCA